MDNVTSQEKEKAKELIAIFESQLPCKVTPTVNSRNQLELNMDLKGHKYNAILCATKCVEQIIDALKTTTGHCELRTLDRQEVQSDFSFWYEVKLEIEICLEQLK